MSKIRFYKINIDYIKYLHSIDKRVQYSASRPDRYTENRPYVGVVLNVNNKCYFAPMEHPRVEHKTLKSSIHIFKIEGGRYGIVGLNNMIPVPHSQLIEFDIEDVRLEQRYRLQLRAQLVFCQNNSTALIECARKVYQRRLHPNKFEKKIFCNFAKLEDAADRYKAHELQNKHQMTSLADRIEKARASSETRNSTKESKEYATTAPER